MIGNLFHLNLNLLHVIDNWVKENMKGFSGACNVQYRGTKIIEVGLRLARGGAYIYTVLIIKH